MAQSVSPEASGVVTVAELIRRCAGPGGNRVADTAPPIPVSAILHRERPAPGHPGPSAPSEPPAPRRGPVQRTALAAGALLAAGSAFGLVTAMNAPGGSHSATGAYPDEGTQAGTMTAPGGGSTGATSVAPVAFPSPLTGAAIADHALTAARAATAAPHSPPATVGSSQGTATPHPQTTTRSSLVAGTTQRLGDTVGGVGRNTPIGGVTSAVGSTVVDVGDAAGTAVAGVGQTATTAVTEVGRTASTAVTGVGHTLDDVTTPLVGPAKSAPKHAAPAGQVVDTVTGLLGGG